MTCLLKLSEAQFASGGGDGSIKIWNSATNFCLKTLQGHEFGVTCLLKLNETQFASGSDDNSIKIWDSAAKVSLSKYSPRT